MTSSSPLIPMYFYFTILACVLIWLMRFIIFFSRSTDLAGVYSNLKYNIQILDASSLKLKALAYQQLEDALGNGTVKYIIQSKLDYPFLVLENYGSYKTKILNQGIRNIRMV